ncbi:hypothetical protein [Caviibacterium pharyngocola]|uniref:Uncharacterized protein n=1 Tax=Caviibacterium pharyngocola TaxID=28159 RepID=A0A2M8RVI8_9PAST|nr:hypothetical protein [Caviibacterium pharyngocola]PJG82908.1 hypothetical protein CVP04_05935 [Caviibacterium pharyngocola]
MSIENAFKKRNDSVFQLSLTEIAFMLIFILLLLLGWMYFLERDKAEHFKQELQQVENKLNEYSDDRKTVSEVLQLLKLRNANPEEIIFELESLLENSKEIERLKEKLTNQDETLTALSEILAEGKHNKDELVQKLQEVVGFRERIIEHLKEADLQINVNDLNAIEKVLQDSIVLNKQLESMIPENINQEDRQLFTENLLQQLTHQDMRDNAMLKGQVQFLRKKLRDANGGRDYPPCWANEETGAIDYLFRIDILNNGLKVTPAWIPERAEDAANIPNLEKLINKVHSRGQFQALTNAILVESNEKQCRHYVRMKNNVNNLSLFNNSRYTIENVFYKLEIRN